MIFYHFIGGKLMRVVFSWEAEVDCDRQFFLAHLDFLDAQLLPYLPTNITSPQEETDTPDDIYNLLGKRWAASRWRKVCIS